jgi:two-component system cell cycle sensor histidine kinase/response regulator CckA
MEQRQRLLLIDDNREIVKSLKTILEQKYDVLTAYDGFDGLKAFEEYEDTIDLVISDLVMPELSGTGVISFIKMKYPGVPVIAITGWVDDIELTGSKVKPDHFLKKPFDISDLEKCITKLLAEKVRQPITPTDLH